MAQVREDLEGPFLTLLETARRVGKVTEECKLPIDIEDYVGSFRPDLMDVMAAWYRGSKFADILKMTEIFEVRSTLAHLSIHSIIVDCVAHQLDTLEYTSALLVRASAGVLGTGSAERGGAVAPNGGGR